MNRSRFLIALGVILCWVLPSLITLMPASTAQAQLASAPWPMFGRNPQHRSFYTGPEIPILKWSFNITGEVISSPAIGADGTLYVGSYDNKLYALIGTEPRPWLCFIATAAYGTPMAKEVEILREFRDEYLLTNPAGQALVDVYYKVSPPIAEFITEHPSLKPIVRAGLLPAVAISTVAVNTSPAEKTAIGGLLVLASVALAVWATKRRGGGPEYTGG